MKVLVYLSENRLNPRGGPLGVGYHYHEEMLRRGDNCLEFLSEKECWNKVHPKGSSVMQKLPKWLYRAQAEIRDIIRTKKFLEAVPAPTGIDFSRYDIVHFHETKDLYIERENLKNFKGKVVLQSHSPLPLGMETCTDLPKAYRRFIKNIDKKYSDMDKYAFMRADYLIFPCEEAEEPYMENWDEYRSIKESRKDSYKYVLTGICDIAAKRGREEVRKELGIPESDFVVSYAGRHNTVKGYDLLSSIGCRFLGESKDNHVVVCGRPGPLETPEAERWTEIGWTTDAHSYIGASDVFILPNRVTYFDLIMLEVLALGKIVVASRTGGNKYFEKHGVPGVLLYDTEDEAIALLEKVKAMTPEARDELGRKNREFFLKNLTVSAMYDQYMSVLKEIYNS